METITLVLCPNADKKVPGCMGVSFLVLGDAIYYDPPLDFCRAVMWKGFEKATCLCTNCRTTIS